MRKKDKIRRKQCRAKNQALRESLKAKFKTYRNTINNLIRRSKTNHYNNFFKSNKQNLIKTWQGIKEIIHSKPKIKDQIPSIRVNGKLCTNETLIANTFSKFFCDIPKKIENKLVETDIHFSNYLKNPGKKSFFLRPTTEGEVESQLKTLKNNKATGRYSIPTKLMKLFPKLISRPLSMLINLSFSVGKFPTILKLGQILPFHKRDDKSNCNNYRPISLISNLSKIIEKIVYSRLYLFLEQEELLYSRQFGFRNNHSATDALIDITEKIKEACDNKLYSRRFLRSPKSI